MSHSRKSSLGLQFALVVGLLLTSNSCLPQNTPTALALPPGDVKVLFIGNSLTYVNDLPGMLEGLAAAAGGPSIGTGTIAFPDFALEDHWAQGDARRAIALGGWNYVAMQQGPSATEGRPSLLSFSETFSTEIRRIAAEPALYMVWPSRARSFDFDGVSESYRMAAQRVGGALFPVGEAWRAVWRRDSEIPLYGPDAFHPSSLGTLVAALTIYARVTSRPAVGLPRQFTYRSGTVSLDAAQARLLQEAVDEALAQFPNPAGTLRRPGS
jgi:hypothetical protein